MPKRTDRKPRHVVAAVEPFRFATSPGARARSRARESGSIVGIRESLNARNERQSIESLRKLEAENAELRDTVRQLAFEIEELRMAR